MEFTQLIHSRYSVRDYDPDRPVPKNILEKILDAGRLAPSARNNQPWKFIVVSSPELLKNVKECYPRDWFIDAPQILIVAGLKDKAWTRTFDGYCSVETDAAIAMSFIILAAANEGVGTCWIMAYDPFKLRDILKVDDSHIIYGITPIGYSRSAAPASVTKNRKPLDEIAVYE